MCIMSSIIHQHVRNSRVREEAETVISLSAIQQDRPCASSPVCSFFSYSTQKLVLLRSILPMVCSSPSAFTTVPSPVRHLYIHEQSYLYLRLCLFATQSDAFVLAARAARSDALGFLYRTMHTDPFKKDASALARHEDTITLRAAAKAYQARKRVSRKSYTLHAHVFLYFFIFFCKISSLRCFDGLSLCARRFSHIW